MIEMRIKKVYKGYDKVCVFQPHRISRLKDLRKEFYWMISSALNSTNYLLILSGFLIISFINRILDKTESLQPNDSASDPHYQLCTAILAREQKTLCPEQRSYGHTRGRYFYPLGSFWYPSRLLVAFPFIKNIFFSYLIFFI